MPSTKFAYRATIGLIWALALWHSWTCRGLFVDGSAFLVQIVRREWFFDFYPPRLHAMVIGQIPVMTAVILGVTDLQWLARLLSFGLFALPTALYHLALWRVRDDPVLLAAVIAPIAIIFMTTAFFIVGEYNTAYAICLLTAVRLATVDELRVRDALFLLPFAILAIRTYEVFIYLGPLMALMIGWTIWRAPRRPILATVLYTASAACFLAGMVVAVDSVIHPWSPDHLDETWVQAPLFWQNMQFDLVFGGALVVVVWGLLRPTDLSTSKPYRWAGFSLAVLALSPLLALSDTLVRPLAKSQYVARTVSGLIVATIIILICIYKSDLHHRVKALVVLKQPEAARKLLAFACAMLLATVPSDLFLTATWASYLDAIRDSVRARPGLIAFEDTPLSRRPHNLLVENWVVSSQSLAVRSKPGDGVILPPKDFKQWVPFPPLEPPNIGRFIWRD